jgi:selenocysteine lyase/cysteine desulfurase
MNKELRALFPVTESPMALYSHLKKRNIITAPRGDRLRVSPHLYNTLEDIDELVNALP